VLRFEFQCAGGGNSGVALRAHPDDKVLDLVEVQILDDDDPRYVGMAKS